MPDAGVDAVLTDKATYSITLAADAGCQYLTILTGAASNVLTLNTAGHTLTSGVLNLGVDGQAAVVLNGGGTLLFGNNATATDTGRLFDVLGYYRGGGGSLTVTGSGTTLAADPSRSLGIGTLAAVTTLAVQNGGAVRIAKRVNFGSQGGIGHLRVSGSGSVLTAGTVSVGEGSTAGTSTMDVSDGGAVVATTFYAGYSGGTGHVAVGPDGRLTVGRTLSVGEGSSGSGNYLPTDLSVVAGGMLATGTTGTPGTSRAKIGTTRNFGTVTVAADVTATSPAEAVWGHDGDLYIGADGINAPGTGVLNVGDGGRVSLTRSITLFASNSPYANQQGGTLNLSGGVLSTTGVAQGYSGNPYHGDFNFTGGTLRAAGTLALSCPTGVGPGGGMIDTNGFDGTVSGVVSDLVAGGTITKAGNGTLKLTAANTYTGATTVTAGTLALTPASYENVLANAGGLDVRGGTVSMDFTGAGSPVDRVRALLVAGYASGWTTGQIRSSTATTDRGLGYSVSGNTIYITSTLYGDADRNGVVNFSDFLLLQSNYNQSGRSFANGDFNYDGSVTFSDFLILQSHYGQSLNGAAVTVSAEELAAVAAFGRAAGLPEPAALSAGVLAVALLRRRRA